VLINNTGARFVAIDGTLYPVINTASARLLITAAEYRMIVTDQDSVSGIPVGPTIGILGAPDDLPAVDALRGDGWTACAVTGDETAVGVASTPLATAVPGAAVVERGDATFVISGGTRYEVLGGSDDAVLRAVGLNAGTAVPVDGRWLNLFTEGDDLRPLEVPGAGDAIEGTTLRVGEVVHPDGAPDDERYLVTQDAELAPISPLAYQLYLLGTGGDLGSEVPVSPAELSSLGTAAEAAGAGWPNALLTPVADGPTCALLQHDGAGDPSTVLASPVAAPAVPLDEPGVRIEASTGAVVGGGGVGNEAQGIVAIIDSTGTSYSIPGADDELLARLGYAPADVVRVSDRWLQFFPAGPELTVAAAGATPEGGPSIVQPAEPDPESSGVAPSTNASAAGSMSIDADGECTPGLVEFSTETPIPMTQLQPALASAISTGAGVRVAIIDSGIDAANQQLEGAVVGGVDLVGDAAGPYTDIDGHGTAIAGIIAARPLTGSGLVGMAPRAEVLSVRVFRATDDRTIDQGFGPDLSKVVAGIRWAIDADADVINLSLSDPAGSPELEAAIADAVARGIVVVASGGNRATAVDTTDGLRYPAAYPGVLAVAAADVNGLVTDASIHGAHIDVSAPGSFVVTTATTAGTCLFTADEPSSSYATAYAAGAAALLVSEFPGASPEAIEYRLMASASRANPDDRDDRAGWGFIQPFEALTMLPDAGVRGPAFVAGSSAAALHPAVAAVSPGAEPPAIRLSREVALTAGCVAIALVGSFVVLTMLRRRPAPVAPPRTDGGLFPDPERPPLD
jgi:type VII secretion protein EccB